MHQSLFIFLSKINEYVIYGDNKWRPHFSPRKVNPKKSEYVIYGDNKQRSLDQQVQKVISIDTNKSLAFDWLLFDDFCIWLLTFDWVMMLVFCLSFLFSLMIMIDSYVDCLWYLFLIVFWWLLLIVCLIDYDGLYLMIVFDGCSWLSFLLSLKNLLNFSN